MKRFLLILTVIFSLTVVRGQTNVYHTFPDSAVWRVDYYCHNILQYTIIANYYFQYSITGDTLINSNVYKKIYRSFVFENNVYHDTPILPSPPPPSGYVGALIDDPAANKTFFVFPDSTNDSLLYNYNLDVGDTLRGFITQYQYNFNIKPVVSSIDSVLVNGQFRKRWNFGPINYSSLYIIEGIGSSAGLIEQVYTYATDFTDRHLVCVKDDTGSIFTSGYNSEIGCNLIYEGLNEINPANHFQCFPNPFSVLTTLQTDIFLTDATLKIYNSSGQQVKQINDISGKIITIHRDNLSSGLYFLKLMQGNKILITNKFVITDN